MLRFPLGFLLIFVGLDCWTFSHDVLLRVHGTVFILIGFLFVTRGFLAAKRDAE